MCVIKVCNFTYTFLLKILDSLTNFTQEEVISKIFSRKSK